MVAELEEPRLKGVISQRGEIPGERLDTRRLFREFLQSSAASLVFADARIHQRVQALERSLRQSMRGAAVVRTRRARGGRADDFSDARIHGWLQLIPLLQQLPQGAN